MYPWMKELLGHLEWADATVWKAVLECDAAGDDEKLVAWLYHIHVVQHAFLKIWRGEPLELPQQSELAATSSLGRWALDGHRALRAYLLALSEADFERELAIPWTTQLEERWNRPVDNVTLAESVLQVTMHTAHHRGQVAARLRELEGEPPLVDFIAWIWQGRPDPEWPPL